MARTKKKKFTPATPAKKRVVGKPFKKGQSGNPKGRPRIPEDLKIVREWNQVELERIVNKLLYMTKTQLARIIKANETPTIERVVARIMQEAAVKGDPQRIEWVVARTLGKMPDTLNLKGAAAQVQSVVILPSNGRELKVDQPKEIEAEKVEGQKEDAAG